MSKFYTNIYSRGDKMYVRGYEDGIRFEYIDKYKPYLFVNAPQDSLSKFRTIHDKKVDKIDFDSVYDARDFIKKYEGVSNFEIYGMSDFKYVYLYDNFHDIEFDVDLINVVSLDIETWVPEEGGFPDIDEADQAVTAITLSSKGEMITFGLENYVVEDPKVTFIKCDNEEDLLRKFIRIWNSKKYNPDIITGWNIELFDIPYLVNRITKLFGKKEAEKLSPWRILEERTVNLHNKEHLVYMPAGIAVLDYLLLYKKFSFKNQESYKLDHIAEQELNENKLDYSKYGSLYHLYTQNYQLFISYNIHDVRLIDKLEEKLKFIEQAIAMTYDARINFQDVFGTVKPWDVIIHGYLMDRNRVVPQFEPGDRENFLMGGFVKEPQIGLTNWVVSFDLTSLYTSLYMQYNISSETYVSKKELLFLIEQEKKKRSLE